MKFTKISTASFNSLLFRLKVLSQLPVQPARRKNSKKKERKKYLNNVSGRALNEHTQKLLSCSHFVRSSFHSLFNEISSRHATAKVEKNEIKKKYNRKSHAYAHSPSFEKTQHCEIKLNNKYLTPRDILYLDFSSSSSSFFSLCALWLFHFFIII